MATTPPNLIVMISFNPPLISLIGPIKERTIIQLNNVLPDSCTTSKLGKKEPPVFELKEHSGSQIKYWEVELRGQFCDQTGVSALFCSLFDCLEEEGM